MDGQTDRRKDTTTVIPAAFSCLCPVFVSSGYIADGPYRILY